MKKLKLFFTFLQTKLISSLIFPQIGIIIIIFNFFEIIIECEKHARQKLSFYRILFFYLYTSKHIHEIKIKKLFKKETITPGIRLDSKNNDQKRIITPKNAYKNGSNWLVIGRPITKGNIKKNIQKIV